MAKNNDTRIIEVVYPNCCGLDVHKESISACLLTVDENGKQHTEHREFKTFTKDLNALKAWLLESKCPVVGIESTGVYWRPVHNVLEGCIRVVLVNARHLKNVPGRKTDYGDSEWLAGLLRCGLLKSSFIPVKQVREWRELARLRKSHINTLGDHKRRVHKIFETANIKIDSVVSDLFGATGRNLIGLLSDEKADLSVESIRQCAKGRLKAKAEELCHSIKGFFGDHHRFQLRGLMRIIAQLEVEIESITQRLEQLTSTHQDLVNRLDEVPGINAPSAQSILGHIGYSLDEFKTPASLCLWAGLCPGNNESAGKRKSGVTPVRTHPFKTIMVEVAWAAIKKKDSYYQEKFYSMRARLGARRAIVAIAHRITKAVYWIIKRGDHFKDLGALYLIDRARQNKLKYLQKQAAKLGLKLVRAEAQS
jgi:transposase